jgi:hypothetical protein
MLSETTPPITKKGLTWPFVLKIMAWVTPLLLAALLAYARTQFVGTEAFDISQQVYNQHVGSVEVRVHSLEEFRVRTEVQAGQINDALKAIGAEQASQKATLTELIKGQERVLNRIDVLADRDKAK